MLSKNVFGESMNIHATNEKLSTAPLKGWTGYAMLDASVQATTPLFERDDVVLEHRTRQKVANK